jgi:hypothetical protein
MPYTWRFYGDVHRSEASGVFTAAEAMTFLQEAAAAERARGVTAHRLADLRAVTDIAIDYSAMREIVARRAETRTKTALLTRNDMQYGMVRMFQALIEDSGLDVKIFSDEAAALAWLADEKSSCTAPRHNS